MSMRGTVHPTTTEVSARVDVSGQRDPRRRDVLGMAAARAHADAEPDDQESAARHRKSRRTQNRSRNEGPREVRQFQTYLFNSPQPYRLEAHVKSLVKQRAMRNRSTADLIADYHELRAHEKTVEGTDNANDMRGGLCWLDRAAAKERDAAVDEEVAAICREFAARGVTEAEVG